MLGIVGQHVLPADDADHAIVAVDHRDAANPLRLEEELVARLRELKNASPWAPALIVAPSRRQVLRLRERLPRELGALLGVEILNYQALAYRLLEGSGEPVPDLLSRVVLERLLERGLAAHPELTLSRYAAERPGVVSELVARVEELREAGIAPGDLAQVASDVSARVAGARVESPAFGAVGRRAGGTPGPDWAQAGYYERAFRVLGRWIDEQRPHDIFFFEQGGAFVVRLHAAGPQGGRHELAEFTKDDIEEMVSRGPSARKA